ncbi:MAG: hypothetical protein Q8R24_00490 [Legionellaceae bacterium]|nr:hypothetical protein [Legionellaceae bacterium]
MGCKNSTSRRQIDPHLSAISDDTEQLAEPGDPHFIDRFINTPCLQPSSLKFLKKLQNKNKSVYDALINHLNLLCDPAKKLFLKAHHFDTVIHHLDMQNKLEPNIISMLRIYLTTENPNIRSIIKTLRSSHLPDIIEQAETAHLVHHTLKHASEMKKRAMRVITDDHGLFASEDDPVDIFIRNIISVFIECHDYEQTNPGSCASVELATAERVTEWLTTPPHGLRNLPIEIAQLIHYIAGYIIPLGTTMVYSPISTMDLSALYQLFETASVQADIPICDPSNAELIKKIQIAAIITGVCDKTPAAILNVVKRQTDCEETNSLAHLEQYQKLKPHHLEQHADKPLMRVFFENTKHPFQAYYPHEEDRYNYQAFLLALIPKLGMQIEFSVAKSKEHDQREGDPATTLGDFIKTCQGEHKNRDKNHKSDLDFLTDFELEFERNNIAHIVESLFFSEDKINKEREFCLSQVDGLLQAEHQIIDCLQSHLIAWEQQIINPTAPMTDAENLEALYQFYLSLSVLEKKRFIQEIALNMILQAGAIYLEQPHLQASRSESNTPINTPRNQPHPNQVTDYSSQNSNLSVASINHSIPQLSTLFVYNIGVERIVSSDDDEEYNGLNFDRK